ncbi:hypothetical protein [Oceanispirochaeta sp.]|jgi:hypothetical protein|uniref:hypothetical protein n=1 Tax=Oceanispirochaeta sp. TaxID=2035350 RepID=UPI00260F6B99|nr:hypothetical protein [Oceanispirochaeta sp.]MDA3957043.1 hypothetical protein [Oceanispirochaeta sp.]
MKFSKILIALIMLAGPILAEDSNHFITMADFDKTFQGFSFLQGELVSIDMEAENLSDHIDFIFDLPNGLGMNNGALDGWFAGKAMILDLGDMPIESILEMDEEDFTPYLIPEELIPGHTYHIKTADTKHQGRIRIVEFDTDQSLLSFNWLKLD